MYRKYSAKRFCEKGLLYYNRGYDESNLCSGHSLWIPLARDLYSKDLLFLNECTSAIYSKSEQYILKKSYIYINQACNLQ